MAEATTTEAPKRGWKKHFPVLAEFLTSFGGALGSDVLVDWFKKTSVRTAGDLLGSGLKHTVRAQFPDWVRSTVDEGLFSLFMEELTEAEQKALEGFLTRRTNFKQRADIILSMVELYCSPVPGTDPETPEGREEWKAQRVRAFEAARKYLKYLANLADDDARERSLLSRNFMRPQNEYPTPRDFLVKVQTFLDGVDNSQAGQQLQAHVERRAQEVARKRAELAQGMRFRDKFKFFTFIGGRQVRAPRAVVPPPQPPALTVVQADNDTLVLAGNGWQTTALWFLGILVLTLLAATLGLMLIKQLWPNFHF
jgi:hypothetical protein